MTGGDYRLLISIGNSYETLTDMVLDLSKLQIFNSEYVLTLPDGFAYGRYAVKSTSDTFLQAGQYTGNTTFNLQTTGFIDDKSYFKSIPITNNSTSNSNDIHNPM